MKAQMHIERGNALFREGNLADAIREYRAALAADAGNARAHFNLGVALQGLQRVDEAMEHYRAAVAAKPDSAAALVNLASLLAESNETREAAILYRRALELDPRDGHAVGNLERLAVRLHQEGASDETRACYLALLAADPRHAVAHFNLGVFAQNDEGEAAAVEHYRKAVASNPNYTEALVNWGNILLYRGEFKAAIALYERAVASNPEHGVAINNLATAFFETGELAKARVLYDRIIHARPDYTDARLNRGLVALKEGDYARGWEEYEHRRGPEGTFLDGERFGLPRLQPPDLLGARRIAIWKEQGIGDGILFSTLLPEIARLRVQAVVETDERLIDVYQRSLPELQFVAPSSMEAAAAECDCQVPIGSLGLFFRRSVESFRRQPQRLLQADMERARAIRGTLPGTATVGISWRTFQSTQRKYVEDKKSIPLECFGIFDRPEISLLDLQYGPADEEREAFDARHPGLRYDPAVDRFADLDGLIAAIAACDLVVTSSNVTAHLAGATGKRTWLAYLGANPQFHYWTPGPDGRSLWYPSVEIITRPEWTRWEPIFEHLGNRLDREGAA